MLNSHGFDLWAAEYGRSVREADRKREYPFADRESLEACQMASGNLWDDKEFCIMFSELRGTLTGYAAAFHPFSACAGVIETSRTQ